MEGKQIAISYTYDELDRLSSVTYGDEKTVCYSYDEAGNLVTVKEALETSEGDKDVRDERASDSTPADNAEEKSILWHLSRGGESFGPYTLEEMLSFAADGRIQPEDLVWNSSMTEWTKARDAVGLILESQ